MEMQKVVVSLVIIVVLSSTVVAGLFYLGETRPEDDVLNFYVFGDSQGYQGSIAQIAAFANEYHPDFVFHCGDLTPFGQDEQYREVSQALSAFEVPVYVTPGNHDIRLGGGSRYVSYFGSARYSFDLGSAHFTVFNTSTNDVSEDEISWLENDLSGSQAEYKFVFTHTPPFDPRPENEHAMTNETSAYRLMGIFSEYNVNTVFAGHIHIYNVSFHDNVRYVITGGAGASLYASPEEGGIYHFVNVTVTETGVEIAPVQLPSPSLERDIVVVRGLDEDMTLSLDDLIAMNTVSGWSSFQNQLDNWHGYGLYQGVRVSDLLGLIGGMRVSDTLRVSSFDGYSQMFSYDNVYPNASWYDVQGDMILAYSLNGTDVLDWTDGMRLVMLPADEAYSNSDCLETSAPGMGYHVYPSAGARWVRFVSYIEVIPG